MTNLMDSLRDYVGEPDDETDVPYWLKTGLTNLDIAIGGPDALGVPGGRLITISGPESCGKTALFTRLVVETQRQGGYGALMDHEHAFKHSHAYDQGLDKDRWYYKQPDTAEEGFDTVYKVMEGMRAAELGIKLPENSKTNPTAAAKKLRAEIDKQKPTFAPLTLGVDSIASLIPESADISFVHQNMKTKNMALPEFLSVELKRMARDASKTQSTIIMLNQLRTNPGVMFGDNTTEPGGNAPKYYASLQVRLRRVEKLYETWGDKNTPVIGDIVEMWVKKNKVARPFVKTRYIFRTADPVGLDNVLTYVYLGKEAEILGAKGGVTIDSTKFLGSDGKKSHRITDFEKLARSDETVRQKLEDYVLKNTMTIEDHTPNEESESSPAPSAADVFAGLKQG